jgi:hypothetical protein
LDDLPLDFGDWSAGLVGDLGLNLTITLVSDDPSASFATTALIGNAVVPEPTLVTLLLVAAVGLSLAARMHRGPGGRSARSSTCRAG